MEGDKGHAAGSADWGPERRIDNGIDKGKAHEQVATSFALALVCDIHASGGKAGPSARHRPQLSWAETDGDMDDPLSKGVPFVGIILQTGENRQRPADVQFLRQPINPQ